MNNKLYVANIASTLNSVLLEELFTRVGDVRSVHLPVDRTTGETCSYGYVEMVTDQAASDCIERFNGVNVRGNTLAVVLDIPRVAISRPVLGKAARSKGRASKLKKACVATR